MSVIENYKERRMRYVKTCEEYFRRGYDYEKIINILGREGISRRTALEYIKAAEVTARTTK